jgi:hypothetical protein
MYGNFHDDRNVQSQQMLEPIFGFINGPILSLKEACQPLHDLIEHLTSTIKFSIKNAENS